MFDKIDNQSDRVVDIIVPEIKHQTQTVKLSVYE